MCAVSEAVAPVHPLRRQRGTLSRVARGLGITVQAVSLWDRVPAERVPDVERITGIPRHELRPDLWPKPGRAA